MHPIFTSLSLIFATALSIYAQPAQPATTRTDLMPVSMSGDLTLYYAHKKQVTKLEVFSSAMGTPVFYQGSTALRFYASEKDLQAVLGGSEEVKPLITVSLDKAARRTLLVFVPAAAKTWQCRAFPIEDDRLGAGEYRVYNFSNKKAAGLMGDTKFVIDPGGHHDVRGTTWRDRDGDLGVQFGYLDAKGQATMTYSSIWGHAKLARQFLFLVSNPQDPTSLDLRKFHDVPSVPSRGYEAPKPQ